MACKYLETHNESIPVIGGSLDNVTYVCKLKLQSQEKQFEIYYRLFKDGHEGSMISNQCPFGENKGFNKCPFCK